MPSKSSESTPRRTGPKVYRPRNQGSGRDPDTRRLQNAMSVQRNPVEPANAAAARPIPPRDLARFSITARLLVQNKRNAEILEHLNACGHEITKATLAKMLVRPDFRDYYDHYREALLAPIDQVIRDRFRIFGPRAIANIEDLADNARSEKVKLEANITILEGGDNLQRGRGGKTMNFNIDRDAIKELLGHGRRLTLVPPPPVAIPASSESDSETP